MQPPLNLSFANYAMDKDKKKVDIDAIVIFEMVYVSRPLCQGLLVKKREHSRENRAVFASFPCGCIVPFKIDLTRKE